MLCQACHCRADATGCREVSLHDVAVFLNVADLNDSPVDVAVESVAQLLCHVAQMNVVVCYLSHVHALAERRVCGIWCTVFDGVCLGEHSVGALSCRSSREETHLEFSSCLMFCLCNLCEFACHGLCRSGWCESAQSDGIAILYQCGGVCRSHTCVSHNDMFFVIYVLRSEFLSPLHAFAKGMQMYVKTTILQSNLRLNALLFAFSIVHAVLFGSCLWRYGIYVCHYRYGFQPDIVCGDVHESAVGICRSP